MSDLDLASLHARALEEVGPVGHGPGRGDRPGADLVEQVQRAAGRGEVASVSAFVERAVREQLTAEAEWGDELARMLEESGGPMTDEERAWVDSLVPPSNRDR